MKTRRVSHVNRAIGPAALCFLAAWAGTLRAEESSFTFDPAQTTINFTTHDTVHTVKGTLKLSHGSMTFDSATGKASGEIVVDATSENTGNGTRDRKVQKDVLESQTYPEISFHPDRIEGAIPAQGDFQLKVHGTFMIHGGGHESTVEIHGSHESDGIAVSATFTVPYQQWGMKNPGMMLIHVSDTVQIDLHSVVHTGRAAKP